MGAQERKRANGHREKIVVCSSPLGAGSSRRMSRFCQVHQQRKSIIGKRNHTGKGRLSLLDIFKNKCDSHEINKNCYNKIQRINWRESFPNFLPHFLWLIIIPFTTILNVFSIEEY